MTRSTITALLAATLVLASCSITGVRDVAIATAQTPMCRAQLAAYLGDNMADVYVEFEALDSTFNQFIAAARGDIDITAKEAFSKVVDAPNKVDLVEADYKVIWQAVVDQPGEASAGLKSCHAGFVAGWDAITGNEQSTSALEAIRVWGPLASSAVCLTLPAACPAVSVPFAVAR